MKPWTAERVVAVIEACGVFVHNPYQTGWRAAKRTKAIKAAVRRGLIRRVGNHNRNWCYLLEENT